MCIEIPLSLETIHLETIRVPTAMPFPAPDRRDCIRIASFAILLQEFHYGGGDRLAQVETIIAIYIIHAGVVDITREWDR